MSVTAKPLINSGYAANSLTSAYTVPNAMTTIVDKFTATNTDVGSQTISINIVPSGITVGNSNAIIITRSISAGATIDVTEMALQMLATGDQVYVGASASSKVVMRMSGREVA